MKSVSKYNNIVNDNRHLTLKLYNCTVFTITQQLTKKEKGEAMQASVVFSAYRCGFIQLSRPFSEVKSTTMSKRKI